MLEELNEIDYSGYSTEELPCAMTDLRWVVWTALGAVVTTAAVVIWAVKRWREREWLSWPKD